MDEYLKHHHNDKQVHDKENLSNHDKCKGHSHSHTNTKNLSFILIITMIFCVIEFFGGIWSNSLALISDSFHMLTDSLSILIALIMAKIAAKPANNKYTYGHGRSEVIGALINSIFMAGIIVFLLYKGVDRILNPKEVESLGIILIASGGLIVNIIAIYLLKDSHSLNSKAALIHVIGDFLGSIAALLAGVLIYFTGFVIFDPLISILVSSILIYPTYKIIKSSIKVLMEGVPEHLNYTEVGDEIMQINGVLAVHDLHIWSMTSDHSALSAHVKINNMESWNEILEKIQETMSEKFSINHLTIQPEV